MKPYKLTWRIHNIEYSPSGDVIMMYVQIDTWELDVKHIYHLDKTHQPFQAGQFMLFSTYIDDKQVKRSYSIATTPSYYLATGLIWFSIKRVQWWVFSTRATQQAKQWDGINLTWPLGHMIDPWNKSRYLFIAAGSWLSPIYSLYNDIVIEKKQYTKAAFLFGERKWDHVLPQVHDMFTQELENNDSSVYMEFFLSQDIHELYTTWRLQLWLDQALDHLDSTDVQCFLCGKPEMVSEVVEILLSKWISKENIKFEKY